MLPVPTASRWPWYCPSIGRSHATRAGGRGFFGKISWWSLEYGDFLWINDSRAKSSVARGGEDVDRVDDGGEVIYEVVMREVCSKNLLPKIARAHLQGWSP